MFTPDHTIIALSGFAATAGLTGIVRRYVIRRGMMDVPNARSSHMQSTPRGGGIALVIVVLAMLPFLQNEGFVTTQTMWMTLVSGAAVALVGWVDDMRSLDARMRLAVHFGAAATALGFAGGVPALTFFGQVIDLGWFGYVLALLYLVWLLNLYNFMDGIDGIAGIEALTVCAAGIIVYAWADYPLDWGLPLALAGSAAGFLVWNLPRARIFLGDSGSGFMGVVLGVGSLQAGISAPELLFAWMILLGCFIVDATFTLVVRFWRGESLHQAHRDHAYQHAAVIHRSHVKVSLFVGLVNLIWLLPLAILAATGGIEPVLGVIVAYVPLCVLAARYHAGYAVRGSQT